VIEELKAISRKLPVTGVALRGRSEMCLLSEVHTQQDYRLSLELCERLKRDGRCPFFKRFLEKEKKLVQRLRHLMKQPLLASEIIELSRKEGVCPYEVAKLLLPQVDVIACSYMYLFNEPIRHRFLRFLGKDLNECIVVLDEAHNIPDVAIDSLSDVISVNSIQHAYEEALIGPISSEARFFLRMWRKAIERLSKNIVEDEGEVPRDLPFKICEEVCNASLSEVIFELEDLGRMVKDMLIREGKLPRSYASRVASFLKLWQYAYDRDDYFFVLMKERTSRGESLKLGVIALDPSPLIRWLSDSVHSLIMTSATLEPVDAFIELIGISEESASSLIVEPPYRRRALCLVTRGITTDFKKRSEAMYSKMVDRIVEVVQHTPGNVGVFTASYEVLEGLINAGLENELKGLNKPLFVESPDFTSRDNDSLIEKFKSFAHKGGAVLLGVQGGRNAEGEDFPGKEMMSVVIVGVPYAKPTPLVKARIEYYEKKFPGKGRLYGYLLPAMKKASQAAGRPLRRLDDKAALIFMDYRFATRPCRRLLPKWIRRSLKVLPDERGALARELVIFFRSSN
ncbi:MAG: DNA repair helicase, partial [Thermoprotei archaeon]